MSTKLDPAIVEMMERGAAQIKQRREQEDVAEQERQVREEREARERKEHFLQAARLVLPEPLRPFVKCEVEIYSQTQWADVFIDLGPDIAEIGFRIYRNASGWHYKHENNSYTVYSYIFGDAHGYGHIATPAVKRYANGAGTARWTSNLFEALAHARELGTVRVQKQIEMQEWIAQAQQLEKERLESNQRATAHTQEIEDQPAPTSEPTTAEKLLTALDNYISERTYQPEY